MPKARLVLQAAKALDMLTKEVEHERTLLVISRQIVEHLAHGEDSPTIATSPMEVRMRVHAFDPTMTEQLYLRHPHLVLEEMELAHGLVGITCIAGITAIPGQGGDSHVHIVEPDGVVMRTISGIGAIRQTIFLVDDEVHISCNQRIVGLRLLSLHLQTDERGCHRATVIEGRRTQYAAHLGVELRVGSQLVSNLGSQFGKHIGTIGDKS